MLKYVKHEGKFVLARIVRRVESVKTFGRKLRLDQKQKTEVKA